MQGPEEASELRADLFVQGLKEASELRADLFVQCLEEASAAEADQACGAAGSRDINLISAVQLYAFTAVKYTFRI